MRSAALNPPDLISRIRALFFTYFSRFWFQIFLFFLLRRVGHLPEARDLILQIGEEKDVSETREWYLERSHKGDVSLPLFKCGEPTGVKDLKCETAIEVNGVSIDEYSECVLISGFPFFFYSKEDKYHVESPVAIEHLGLPYKVTVEMGDAYYDHWKLLNTYHNGVVTRRSLHKDMFPHTNLRVKLLEA